MSQADVDAGRRLGCAMRDLQPISGLNRKQRLAILIRQAAKHAFNIREMPYSAEYLYINNDVRVFSASEWEIRLFRQIETQIEKSGFATFAAPHLHGGIGRDANSEKDSRVLSKVPDPVRGRGSNRGGQSPLNP
ncbi:MAG TPA: hypothetical protein VIK79_17110, partial [Xanthobacteraceae bacterium]